MDSSNSREPKICQPNGPVDMYDNYVILSEERLCWRTDYCRLQETPGRGDSAAGGSSTPNPAVVVVVGTASFHFQANRIRRLRTLNRRDAGDNNRSNPMVEGHS
ncbi:hypothetical protein VOLCADRAFT_96378 [Volvox carteri f. nagariensis]|uniref:Uncharacterized protein n=1 Tax=Volvox carteri f. nagariensis TaxID=3068 RepID=D8U9Z1_VOLCA|nr:uncharacterized protein VOLCADRAFT_96378 [Volvox carteri f. nagariensis]EFJ43496.1 hypothetical protein VOLCADRAFT_96378 [Volvox carteri f. nagariensis]|eukprot:XP_002955425.1 hypothetical protein VOLCADRAFT_96378 [Volvox carteri f. nagariensis]